MKFKKNLFFIFSLSCFVFLVYSSPVQCEFYEYLDKNGVKCYTDDPAQIPDKKREKTRVHVERFDGLSDEEKEEVIKEEETRLKEIKEKQKEQKNKHEMWLRKAEYEEREQRRMRERADSEERQKKYREERKRKYPNGCGLKNNK